MKKKILPVFMMALILMSALVLMPGCGSSTVDDTPFSMDNKELSKVIGVEESALNSDPIHAQSKTGISALEDIYVYEIEANETLNQITINTREDLVYSVELRMEEGRRSEYGIYGIHIGDTMDAAKAIADKYYSDEGSWFTTGSVIMGSYTGNGNDYKKKGALLISVDSSSNIVTALYLVKE